MIALVADIEKAFLNVEVDSLDRDCLRSLWVKLKMFTIRRLGQ
jgi:hypothetical protein